MLNILIIDRDEESRTFLTKHLQEKSVHIISVDSGISALKYLKKITFDFVFAEVDIKDLNEGDFYKYLKIKAPLTPLISMTDKEYTPQDQCFSDSYIMKPLKKSAINKTFSLLSTDASSSIPFIAKSPQMKSILDTVRKIATSQANIFISGESGTGKEVIATLIHYYSTRKYEPYIKVNCAALPDTLIESEFFGHEKGAYTGAVSKRAGRFELADHGTLLLDEVSEIPSLLQAKLLRAVQEQEFERLGGSTPIRVDVRLISTSNRNMQEAMKNKEFREDLFYRLNVIPIHLPPLRTHPEDIIPLANFFLTKLCKKNQTTQKHLSPTAKKKLCLYPWPGNARELANVLEHAIVMNQETLIEAEHIYLTEIFHKTSLFQENEILHKGLTIKELEKSYIEKTLKDYQFNRTKTALALGISIRSLRNKLTLYKSHINM